MSQGGLRCDLRGGEAGPAGLPLRMPDPLSCLPTIEGTQSCHPALVPGMAQLVLSGASLRTDGSLSMARLWTPQLCLLSKRVGLC